MNTFIKYTLQEKKTDRAELNWTELNWTANVSRIFIILWVNMNVEISELKDDVINGFDSANE